MEEKLHILYLPRWYPHRYDPMPGLFIQRQAEAAASLFEVAVLYVHSDIQAVNKYEIDIAVEHGVHVVRVYYRESRINTAGLGSFLRFIRFRKAHLLGFRVLRSFGADLVHVHVLTREGIIALENKIRKKTPYVITEHWSRYLPSNNTYHGFFRKVITRLVVASASTMITVSNTLKASMLEHNLKNRRFRVVPNPVDTSLFTLAPKRPDNMIKRFIHISCFEDRPKNISGLLNAVLSLSGKRSDFECILIGDGPEFNFWKDKAKDLGMLGRIVFFTGLKEGKELVGEIQSSDFMVLSSNYETFGSVVIECLSCGIPVVATSVGIVPELINVNNGIIIPAGDTDALEEGINKMLDTFMNYSHETVRKTILDKFDAATVGKQLALIYRESAGSIKNRVYLKNLKPGR